MSNNKKNILVICSDQHNPLMMGCRNHPIIKTPNLDKLAEDGSLFTRAYCNSPICTPSRMSFITGKYVHQIGSWTIGVPLDRNIPTWASELEKEGIETTMLGKMDFCGPYQDGGFGSHRTILYREAWKDYPRNTPYKSRLKGWIRKDKIEHIEKAGICHVLDDMVDNDEEKRSFLHYENDDVGYYSHDKQITDWTVSYIKEKGKHKDQKDNPWALYVGLLYPHWPYTVPEKYFNMYYPDNVILPKNFRVPNEKLHPALQGFQRGLNIGSATEEMLRKTIAAYYGMITALDDMIGEIINELKTHNLYDDTCIIYTSDHGETLGEHGLFYKQCSYEGSVGVPLIVKHSDSENGQQIDDPVSLVDMFPTVLDIAGLECGEGYPGNSWLQMMQNTNKANKCVFSEFHGNLQQNAWFMLADSTYKYTYYVNQKPTLFDINNDPFEDNNLAENDEYAKVLKAFENKLREKINPEEVDKRAKKDLGLISETGEDYTLTLTYKELLSGIESGKFKPEPQLI